VGSYEPSGHPFFAVQAFELAAGTQRSLLPMRGQLLCSDLSPSNANEPVSTCKESFCPGVPMVTSMLVRRIRLDTG
jgi:hypothetical protein